MEKTLNDPNVDLLLNQFPHMNTSYMALQSEGFCIHVDVIPTSHCGTPAS